MNTATRGELMRTLIGLHLGLSLMLVSMRPWVWAAWGAVTVALVVVLAVSLLRH